MRQPRRNRSCRDSRASVGLHLREWRHPIRAPLLRVRATACAKVRDESPATTAPASPGRRIARPAARYIGSSPLLETELGCIDLSAALEVHSDAATAIGREDAIDIFSAGDRSAVDLHDDVACLETDLFLHPIAYSVYQGALTTLDLILRADRRSQRDQLDLTQDGHARRIYVGQINNWHRDRDFTASLLHYDRIAIAKAELEKLGVPIVWIVEGASSRTYYHIARPNASARCRRSGND